MKVQKTIECEVRGSIGPSDFNELRPYLEKKLGKFNESSELVVFFRGQQDLRLKVTREGVVLSLKETVGQRNLTRSETEIKLGIDQLEGLIRILSSLGFKKGLFSYAKRFDANRNGIKLSVKFNTQIGDVFELEKLVSKKSEAAKAQKELRKFAKTLGLKIWSKAVYKKIIQESWAGVEPRQLLVNGTLNGEFSRVIKENSNDLPNRFHT